MDRSIHSPSGAEPTASAPLPGVVKANHSTIYAKLTPHNAAAKLCFHYIAHEVLAEAQPAFHRQFMHINSTQAYDPDVAALLENRHDPASSDDRTEPDTETETTAEETRKSDPGLRVWSGSWLIDLRAKHPVWLAGRGGNAGLPQQVHFLLCPTSHKEIRGEIRGRHVKFTISPDTGYVRVRQYSLAASFDFDGQTLGKDGVRDVIRQSASIRIGNCNYVFEYQQDTPAITSIKDQLRLQLNPGGAAEVTTWELTPTPAFDRKSIGKWAFGTEIGKGASGKVYSAVCDEGPKGKAQLAAIKIIDVPVRTPHRAIEEIQILQQIEELAAADDSDRIIRLLQVFPTDIKWDQLGSVPFKEVYLVFIPLCKSTLSDLLDQPTSSSESKRQLFHDALLGVQWLHSKGWVHRDLKPDNIGVHNLRAILLDIGTARKLAPGTKIQPTPGVGGTRGYLAPEQEWSSYDAAVDVWSMGVVGYELKFGGHPWPSSRVSNPWRRENKALLEGFLEQYNSCIQGLVTSSLDPVNNLLAEMLRLGDQVPGGDRRQRITIDDAVGHCTWTTEEDGDNPAKRARRL